VHCYAIVVAVLIEAWSVILRVEAVEERYRGGLGAFKSRVPNDTLATDGLLLRVGFMGFHDAMAYMTELERAGLWGQVSGTWVDFVLADQRKGVPDDVAVAWLNAGRMTVDGGSVMAGWLNGTEQGALAVPVAWQFGLSLSSDHMFVSDEELGKRFRRESVSNRTYVLTDTQTGARSYYGSPLGRGQQADEIRAFCHEVQIATKRLEDHLYSLQRTPAYADEIRQARDDLRDRFLARLEELAAGPGRHLPELHYSHGGALRILNRREEAVAAFEYAQKISIPWEELDVGTVQCMLELGWYAGAVQYGEASVKNFPESLRSWGNLAAGYLGLERLEDAEGAISRALQLDPSNAINIRIGEEIAAAKRRRVPFWRRLWSN
jgi:hypothetical protein